MVRLIAHLPISGQPWKSCFNSKDGAIDRSVRAASGHYRPPVSIPKMVRLIDIYMFHPAKLNYVSIPKMVRLIAAPHKERSQPDVRFNSKDGAIDRSVRAASGHYRPPVSIPKMVRLIDIYMFHPAKLNYVSIPKMVRLIGYYKPQGRSFFNVSIPKMVRLIANYPSPISLALSCFNSKDGAIDSLTA